MKIGCNLPCLRSFMPCRGPRRLEAFETVSGVPFYEAAPGIIACAGGVSKVNGRHGGRDPVSEVRCGYDRQCRSGRMPDGDSHRQPGGRRGLCAARCGHLCHR